jgi:hypothetical protein
MKITRRAFLAGSAVSLIGWRFPFNTPVAGELRGANFALGHRRLRADFPSPSEDVRVDVLIIGGGIAALSAARRLQAAGVASIAVVELEGDVGGNAIGGRNEVSAYPWGAHYLPLPNNSNVALLRLLEELKVATLGAKPEYQEEYLCASPQERLHIYGKWQDGLVPRRGVARGEQTQLDRFHSITDELCHARGADGKFLFDIPLDNSSQDPDTLHLDTITMREWLVSQGLTAPELHWYVNYCCRDDYGTSYEETSAWAGLHYFCARRADPLHADSDTVLTWNEGNHWLVREMRSRLHATIYPETIAYRIDTHRDNSSTAYCYSARTGTSSRVTAKACVLAVPRFVRDRLTGATAPAPLSYAPWIVSNITLSAPPRGAGVKLCWDNVVYKSRLLGYVHAKHQSLEQVITDTVVTYYYPMSEYPPDMARMIAYDSSLPELQGIFLKELMTVNPELEGHVTRADVWIWGHAMARPTMNTIWGTLRKAEKLSPGLFAAHSDQSGISIFEEAFYRGIQAAESVMAFIGKKGDTWL